MPDCLTACLPVHLPVYLPDCPSVYLPVYLPDCPSVHLPVYETVCLSVCPSVCLCVCSYFKQKQLFGLSCYEKIPVASQEERGARMKSVGLLAVGYSDLHHHMAFLKRQVRWVWPRGIRGVG